MMYRTLSASIVWVIVVCVTLGAQSAIEKNMDKFEATALKDNLLRIHNNMCVFYLILFVAAVCIMMYMHVYCICLPIT